MEKYRYSDEEQAFLEKSPIPFAVYQFLNKKVVTLIISKGLLDLMGVAEENRKDAYDLMDNNMYRDTHPDDVAAIRDEALRFATEGGMYDVVYRTKVGGEYRIVHSYGMHIQKEGGVTLACIWYTDQGPYVEDGQNLKDNYLNTIKNKLTERTINSKYMHDYLTGLPAMTYFFDIAEAGCKEIRDGGEMPAILYTDFNGMKVYNQKYGLPEGDRLLKHFSEDLIFIFGQDNCSRFNADHFCIFTDEETARKAASKLIKSNKKSGIDSKISLRIGIYVYDDESVSISGACDRAKIACDSGRSNYSADIYYFDSKMMTAIEDKQYVVENIDNAISEGWIRAFYQPIVRTANGKVCHEEALSRWIDPVKGMFSPAAFIPALEETNTIYKLDLCIVDQAIKRLKEQIEKEMFIAPISVNLSRSDFYTCDIVEEIRDRVDKAGIPRDLLVIEITESIVANDIDYMIGQIERFKELGFAVWMDDYGSGYSSPIILQKVPFDLIKIDMLFVRQLEESERARIILTETVRMAMSLGLDTVAEGVETKEQADFLNDIGCTMLQGFYFSKPVPVEDIFEKYKNGAEIGFENPEESDYYAKLGKVNLYNLYITDSENDHQTDYFNTWPMVMIECKGDKISVVKANITFKKYVEAYFPQAFDEKEFKIEDFLNRPGSHSLEAVLTCAREGKRVIVDDKTKEGKLIQILAWRIAVNPVSGVSAIMIAVLSSMESHIGIDQEKNGNELHKISGEYAKLQKENERLKEEADASRKIAELKKSVTALLTNMPAMTFSKDVVTRKYLACNQAFADYAHKETPEGVVGLTDFEIFDPATAYHFIEDDKKALAMDGPYIFFEDVPDAEGNMRQFQTTKLRFTDDTGRECLLGLCQDVTEAMQIKREYTEKLAMVQNMAEIDSLTGIKNKNSYKEREILMNKRIAEHRQPEFAIIVCDMNNLKVINDTLGHEAGDKCICEACDIICKTFKQSPVYRIGGDEFVVISQDEDYGRSEELLGLIAQQNEKSVKDGGIVIACGMARFTNEKNVASVFEKADQKMYENKKYLKSLSDKK